MSDVFGPAPEYICTRRIRALKIASIDISRTDDEGWQLRFEDTRYGPVVVTRKWYNEWRPEAGGYYVWQGESDFIFEAAETFESSHRLA